MEKFYAVMFIISYLMAIPAIGKPREPMTAGSVVTGIVIMTPLILRLFNLI